jgi:multidrug resistance efflux pump
VISAARHAGALACGAQILAIASLAAAQQPTPPPSEQGIVALPGRVVPAQRFALSLAAGERVVKLLAEEGDRVEKGEPLAQLANDSLTSIALSLQAKEEGLATEQEKLEVLRLDVTAARASLDRLEQRLREEEALRAELPDYPFEAAVRDARDQQQKLRSELAVMEKRLELAQARVSRVKGQLAAVRSFAGDAEPQLSRLLVRAPFAGEVVHVRPDPERASTGMLVLELWDTSALRVEARVWQHQLRHVRVGDHVRVLPEFFQNESFQGVISEVGVMSEAAGEGDFPTFPVVVDLPAQSKLQVGIAVTVQVPQQR